MMTEPLILAFDTSGGYCAAALVRGDHVVAQHSEELTRGQAERLMPLLEEHLQRNDVTWADLTRIAVGIGPGNFTGIRISVSAARGLALGLGIPAIGINSFDAIRGGTSGTAAIPAPRDMAFVQTDLAEPRQMPRADVPAATQWPDDPATMAASMARLAVTRPAGTPPAPLYLRPADAAPPRDAPPVILDDA